MTHPPKHRFRKAIRLPEFDYSGNETYFVTICTTHRAKLFGEIFDGSMLLTPAGEIANVELHATSIIRPEIEIHHGVVMPNHVHILLTNTPAANTPSPPANGLQRPPRSLGSFVAGYKAAVTREVRLAWRNPNARIWQPNYHEHVVRNTRAFEQIWDYIEHNPHRWSDDGENPDSPKFRP